MTSDPDSVFTQALSETIRLHELMKGAGREAVLRAASAMAASLAGGGKVLAFGNGGSASDAQHLAAELVGRFLRERRALPAIALTTDTSILTAVANDYGYDRVFARQVPRRPQPRGNRLQLLGIRGLRDQHHERRQILIQRTEAVADPTTHARKAGQQKACRLQKRTNPYVPIFSKTPASITETAVGASTCAKGSHV